MSRDAYIHRRLPGAPGGPTLFLLHGTGGDENQLVPLGRQLLPDATLISPRGDVSEHGAARFFRRTGEGVYDMADLARATDAMAAFVEAHGRGTVSAGLGYSNGANILATVFFARPDLFDAVVLMHPLIPFEPRPAPAIAGRRVLITAGRHDPICPAPMTQQLADRLRAAGADVTTVWHDGGHEVRPEEIDAAQRFLSPLAGKGEANE